jgi:ribonuclease G
MSNVLVMNTAPQETRVAVLSSGSISEFYLERRRKRGVVGNVYKGRVLRVLPGMEAAFVDIGLEKAAFLHVDDVYDQHAPLEASDDDDREEPPRRKGPPKPIDKLLREGQDVLVQVVKDPIGTKGARVTCHITLPGRHLVFMPTVDHLGISRQIASEKERKRLRDIAAEMRPKGGGFIVRTASEGVPTELIRQDMSFLIGIWNDVLKRRDGVRAPKRLYEDLDLVLRATRDLAASDLDSLIVDSRDEFDRILEFIDRVMPQLADRVELYVGKEPIFDAYGIEFELQRALQRKVPLPSGGYLVIEKTEALTSIDINTGKFVGSDGLEDTILRTNVEAAREIAYQLKLRNIGGLIIIDFIDMSHHTNRDTVFRALDDALQGDKGRVKITKISEFGLVEMTRKRTRESIEQMLCEPCSACGGTGQVRSVETVVSEVLRQLHRDLGTMAHYDVQVLAHPRVVSSLKEDEKASLKHLELRFNKKLQLIASTSMAPDHFEVTNNPSNRASQAPAAVGG